MAAESTNPRIELICPKCDHKQMEPAMVVSTLCRGCGFHIQVEDGSAVARVIQVVKIASESKPPIQNPTVGKDTQSTPTQLQKTRNPSRGFLRRIFQGTPTKRSVDCIQCRQVFEVVSDAQSSQCPSCGSYISLKDFDITNEWRREIQTRGNVVIQKEGIVIGTKIICHDILILGKLSACIECSGKLVIRSSGRMIGDIKCSELRIEKGASVEFQGSIEADNIWIDGKVRAQLNCSGTITLGKKAHLQGPARAQALVVKSGAKHHGALEIINSSENPKITV